MVLQRHPTWTGIRAMCCPTCDSANRALRKKGKKDRYFGTLFVPLSILEAATVRAERGAVVKQVACHEAGHKHTVQIMA